MMTNETESKTRNLTDQDFYQQACSYFYYHAEQRTTMINYFIAVFAACIALYGSLISQYPFASVLISVFLMAVSFLFYSIDLRNRFDVKQSQNVIAQIERDYKMDALKDENANYVYGVFSNEDNTFKYYGLEKRWGKENKSYRKLRRLYKRIRLNELLRFNKKKLEVLQRNFDEEQEIFLKGVDTISKSEFVSSMSSKSIISLSRSIKFMYYLCMLISFAGICFAAYVSYLKYFSNVIN